MLDEYPHVLVKRREKFVFGLVCVCYLGALSTLTYVSCITSNHNVLWLINSFKTEHPPSLIPGRSFCGEVVWGIRHRPCSHHRGPAGGYCCFLVLWWVIRPRGWAGASSLPWRYWLCACCTYGLQVPSVSVTTSRSCLVFIQGYSGGCAG